MDGVVVVVTGCTVDGCDGGGASAPIPGGRLIVVDAGGGGVKNAGGWRVERNGLDP